MESKVKPAIWIKPRNIMASATISWSQGKTGARMPPTKDIKAPRIASTEISPAVNVNPESIP